MIMRRSEGKMRSEKDPESLARVLDMVLIGNDILSRDNENLGSLVQTMALHLFR